MVDSQTTPLNENIPTPSDIKSNIIKNKQDVFQVFSQKKFLIIGVLAIFIIVGAIIYKNFLKTKTVSQSDPNSYSESTLLTPPPNFTPPVIQSSKLSYPKSDTEIILFSGILHKDLRFESQPWYRLPSGSYESGFDQENEGNFLLKVLDREGKTIRRYQRDTKSMFIMFVDPGGAIETNQAPIVISIPYGWNSRYLTLEIDGKIIFNEQIHIKLLDDYINNLSDDIFVTSRNNFNSQIDGLLTNFRIILEENNDISAARLLEYELLPLIQSELKSNIKKNYTLETNKEDVIDLLTNTVARLDPSAVTYQIINPTPTAIYQSDQKIECYCSICAGRCQEIKFREKEECPLPPPENFAKCEKSSCVVRNGRCTTVPKISN